MRIPDKESSKLCELEERLQGAYKQIDEIQIRIDEGRQKLGIDKIFIDAKDTSNESSTHTDTRPQHIPGESV